MWKLVGAIMLLLFGQNLSFARAISVDSIDEMQISMRESTHFDMVLPLPAFEAVNKVRKIGYVVDLQDTPSYQGDIENTRFTSVASLEYAVETILDYKKKTPQALPWAVFDVDETLIDRKGGGRKPIHSKINALLQKLVDINIPVILLTMSSNPKPKFERAGLKYDGVITESLLSRDLNGQFIPKGQRLSAFIKETPHLKRPSHMFFMDDRLHSDSYVISKIGDIPVYIESVKNSMRKEGIPFTTFHFNRTD